MSILYDTGMKEMPKSCAVCNCSQCKLPNKRRLNEEVIKKEYFEKRHKDCPLVEK